MTPQHIIAASVFVFVFFLGLVGVIDAVEPGRTLDDLLAGEIGFAIVALGGAAVGLVIGGVSWRRANKPKRGEPADDERN